MDEADDPHQHAKPLEYESRRNPVARSDAWSSGWAPGCATGAATVVLLNLFIVLIVGPALDTEVRQNHGTLVSCAIYGGMGLAAAAVYRAILRDTRQADGGRVIGMVISLLCGFSLAVLMGFLISGGCF